MFSSTCYDLFVDLNLKIHSWDWDYHARFFWYPHQTSLLMEKQCFGLGSAVNFSLLLTFSEPLLVALRFEPYRIRTITNSLICFPNWNIFTNFSPLLSRLSPESPTKSLASRSTSEPWLWQKRRIEVSACFRPETTCIDGKKMGKGGKVFGKLWQLYILNRFLNYRLVSLKMSQHVVAFIGI